MAEEGYEVPTPIQMQAIPPLLAFKDLLGIAQTGTGKTAAFALPILHRLASTDRLHNPKSTRILVLAPTRELASQVAESFSVYGKYLYLRIACIFGGVGQGPQVDALSHGLDVLVATPGRLLDLIGQGKVHLKTLEVFVLDEADRMLDMGFIHDIRRIVALLPASRQNLFFSATMPSDIAHLSATILNKPVRVEVTPESTPIERIEQSLYFVEKGEKSLLLRALLQDPAATKVLVFTRTKHGANRVCEHLQKGGIAASAIHGNKSQTRRTEAMNEIVQGTIRVLVATDIAARGIDVDGITHVVNFDLPEVPETYVHRIGRTARAGATGIAYSFCASDERGSLRDIERLIRTMLPVVDGKALISSASKIPVVKAFVPEHLRRLGPPINYSSGKKNPTGKDDRMGQSSRPLRAAPKIAQRENPNNKGGKVQPYTDMAAKKGGNNRSYSANAPRSSQGGSHTSTGHSGGQSSHTDRSDNKPSGFGRSKTFTRKRFDS